MKYYKRAILVSLILLPLFTLFAFDHRYNAVEDGLCAKYSLYRDLCDYPERHEKRFLLNTNFYRHLGSLAGRDEGTSLAFINSVREISTSDTRGFYYQHEAEKALGKFNRAFFGAMFLSVAVSASALTYYACSKFNWTSKKLGKPS